MAVTWDASKKGSNITITGDGLVANRTGTQDHSVASRVQATKPIAHGEIIYFELVMTAEIIQAGNQIGVGVNTSEAAVHADSYYATSGAGSSYGNWKNSGTVATYATGDVIGVIVNYTASTPCIKFYKNGVLQGQYAEIGGLVGTKPNVFPFICMNSNSTLPKMTGRFAPPYAYFPAEPFPGFPEIVPAPYDVPPYKILVESGGDLYKYTTEWVNVGSSADDTTFNTHGMSAFSFGNNILSLESPSIKVKTSSSSHTLTINGSTKPALVLASGDIDLWAVHNIDSFTLTGSAGTGSLRLIASTDSGATWQAYKSNSWSTVDTSNLENVANGGMTLTEFNAVSSATWNSFALTSKTIRFGYYLEGNAYTDAIAMQVDMRGTWNKAVHGTDYYYEYPAPGILNVTLLANGDFKVNY